MSKHARPSARRAHAAPFNGSLRTTSLRVSPGRHGQRSRSARAALPALLLTLSAGGLALVGALPAATPDEPQLVASTPDEIRTTSVARDAPSVDPVPQERRASRSRRTGPEPELEPAPVPLAAVPVPVPPAPPAAPVLPGCSGVKPTGRFSANGQLPASVLCRLPGDSDEKLRTDAAVAFVAMAADYEKALGRPICLTDGYRTLPEQQALRRQKPGLSARPGTSEHGWGLAVDLSCGVESFSSREHAWLRANAGAYGWELPTWARRDGSRPEPWHWQYTG